MASLNSALSKFDEVIANSKKKCSSCPTVYQLPTTTEKSGSLTRVTVGNKNIKKQKRTILLVGETGTGKSTLVNALFNYALGVTFEDEIWFEITEENEDRGKTGSQASDVIVYQIFGFENKTLPFSLTIIDTPGYGDYRGIQHDDEISQMLLEFFQSNDGVAEVHVLGLVMKATDDRVSDRLRSVFNSVVSQCRAENTVALITHSDGTTPHNILKALEEANIACSKNEKNQFIYFVFNNQQKIQRAEENKCGLEDAWSVSEKGLCQIKTFLEKTTPKNIKQKFETLAKQGRSMTPFHKLQEKIKFPELKKRDLNMIQEAVKKHKEQKIDKTDARTRATLQHKIESITSYLISPGPPAVYQLKTKTEKMRTLTRVSVGQKDVKKPNKTILLVGETGTGKSTLVNTLVNYSMGVKFEDGVWFQIVEDGKRTQTESQTSDVIIYQIFEYKTLPFSLTIIDTPGFGDTREIERDFQVSQTLLDLFRSEDGVHEINAVGLVMKASTNRLSDRLMYIFDSVMSLFGNDLEKNIVALMTYSDGTTPEDALHALEVAEIKCAKDKMNQPIHFMFNNKQKAKRDTAWNIAALKQSWDLTSKQMESFTDYLMRTRPQTLTTTVEVLNERVRLEASIQNLKERINNIELKQEEIKQIQDALKKHEKEMEMNEEFSIEVDEVYKEKEPIDTGMWGLVFFEAAVCCTKCEENCHYPGCTLAWYPGHCEVMKKGHCTVCTNRCPASDHVKEKWKYVSKTRKVKKTVENIKKCYKNDMAECKNSQQLSLLENLEREVRDLSAEKSLYLEEAFQYVVSLDNKALNALSLSTLVHLDFLIEKMEEKGDTLKAFRLKEMKRAVDEKKANSVLRYMMSFYTTGKNRFMFWTKQ